MAHGIITDNFITQLNKYYLGPSTDRLGDPFIYLPDRLPPGTQTNNVLDTVEPKAKPLEFIARINKLYGNGATFVGMPMDKMKWIVSALVMILVFAGAGTTIIYLNGEETRREKESLAVRTEMQAELSSIQQKIWGQLSSVSENLTKASIDLRITGLNGTEARAILNDLFVNVIYGIDVATIDIHGKIVAAEPEIYHDVEGTDISEQSQVQRMLETMMPVMSDVFVMAEGFTATDIEVPVFTNDGVFNGSVSVALDLESMIRDIVNASMDTERFQFTCLQTDGLEVYDTDEDQIGKNLFTDPAYENYTTVLDFMHDLIGKDQGYGTYEYYRTLESKELVGKEVYWSSVGMYGVDWRLLIIHAL
jgi:hypothetical protein